MEGWALFLFGEFVNAACLGPGVGLGIFGQELMNPFQAKEDITGQAIDFFVEVRDFEFRLQIDVVLDVGVDAVFAA